MMWHVGRVTCVFGKAFRTVMRRGMPRSAVKVYLGWVGERVGEVITKLGVCYYYRCANK